MLGLNSDLINHILSYISSPDLLNYHSLCHESQNLVHQFLLFQTHLVVDRLETKSELCFFLEKSLALKSLVVKQFNGDIDSDIFLRLLPSLNAVSFVQCGWVKTEFLGVMGRKFKNLTALDLSGSRFTGDHVLDWPECIQRLSLENCTLVTNKDLMSLSGRLRNLRSLNVRGCYKITATGLNQLLSVNESLEYLNVARLRFLRNLMATLVDHCPNLKSLIAIKVLCEDNETELLPQLNQMVDIDVAFCRLSDVPIIESCIKFSDTLVTLRVQGIIVHSLVGLTYKDQTG